MTAGRVRGVDTQTRMVDASVFERTVADRLLASRVVVLDGEVDDAAANRLTAELLHLERTDRDADIWLYVDSPGGSVTAGLAIYDTMQMVGPDVGTVCLGLAASVGQFLLSAGAPGKRFVLPSARVKVCQPFGGVAGRPVGIAVQAEVLRSMNPVLGGRAGQPVGRIVADSGCGRWFSAVEAKEYGLVDAVIVRRGVTR